MSIDPSLGYKALHYVRLKSGVQFWVETVPAPKPVGPWKPRSTGVLKYRAYKQIIQLRANSLFPSPMEDPVALSILFRLPVPKSWPAREKGLALERQIQHTSKPDLKNLIAGVEDALTGIAWTDDSAVVNYVAPMGKMYAAEPGTLITVYPWADRFATEGEPT